MDEQIAIDEVSSNTRTWREDRSNAWQRYVSRLFHTYFSFLKGHLTKICSVFSVRMKMEKGDGMSFAEFTYPLLQAWDWWHMYLTKGIQLQIGGADQYGNIVAGIDIIKYIKSHYSDFQVREDLAPAPSDFMDRNAPTGLTVPLLTTSSGLKFGKSANNAIWLDKDLTSIFDFYQVIAPYM